MADEKKKISELLTASTVQNDDYVILNNTRTPSGESDTTAGSRKILASSIGGSGGSSALLISHSAYEALTEAQKKNGTIYFCSNSAEPNYDYEIDKDGQLMAVKNLTTNQILWYLNGFRNNDRDYVLPTKFANYLPSSDVSAKLWDSEYSTTQIGWVTIGVDPTYFPQPKIRTYNTGWGSLTPTSPVYAVIDIAGGTEQDNNYEEPPIGINKIYYMGERFV